MDLKKGKNKKEVLAASFSLYFYVVKKIKGRKAEILRQSLKIMNISVIGCGRWGSFIAWYLNKIGHKLFLYGKNSSKNYQKLLQTRKNDVLYFDENINITSDLDLIINSSEIIVISIGAQSLRNLMVELASYDLSGKTLVLCMKGIESFSGKRLSQVVREFFDEKTQLAIWVGPGHVQDFARGIPNCMVLDSECEKVKKNLIELFSSDLIRFYLGTDLIGSEIGAASKNVIGLAAGMLDGINMSSLKGALMARGTREIARLIKAMGGNELSAYGLCHLGDYQATLFSEYSHNRKFGENFIRGEKYDSLAEGVATATALVKLGKQYQVELPICETVDNVINKGANPTVTLSNLFLRSIKAEF